jgi:hypothetical protein
VFLIHRLPTCVEIQIPNAENINWVIVNESIESQLGSFLEACCALTLAIHQTPKREAFVCRDASSRFVRDRRSRQLAAGLQTKGADIHFQSSSRGRN